MTNKNHWYDGLIYNTIIAPNQDNVFGRIRDFIDEGSAIIDVGCGIGRLAVTLRTFSGHYQA